jgi:hypothetical protein
VAHFKLETGLIKLMCAIQPGEELLFSYKSPAAEVRLKQGGDQNGVHRTALCTAVILCDIEPDLKAEIADCIQDDYVKIDKLQKNSIEQVDRIFEQLRTLSRSTVRIFNWRYGLYGPIDPFGRADAWLSEDGSRWISYSLLRSIHLRIDYTYKMVDSKEVQADDVVRFVEAGIEEPLGRQLLREAWSQVDTNPRSALVIGVAAAEIGLKGVIAALVPGTEWLMKEMPSPPVVKILKRFFPTLRVKAKRSDGGSIMPPSKIIKQMNKAVELRNDIIHAGDPAPNHEEVQLMMMAITDFLWMCDIYLGEHWASRHISHATIEEWESKKKTGSK